MKQKRFVIISIVGAMILIGALAVALAPRSAPTARSLSPAALAIISAPNTEARVSPFDLQCTAKFPGGLAQCGSQASSCKNCHEVKAEDAVNAKGDWHISHAFGDFCEFCHGGNVQAPDKAAAHEGLVAPLGDIKTNCSSCHADDLQARAEKYATALGVKIGDSGASGGAANSGGASSGVTTSQPTTKPSEPSQPAPQTAPQAAPPPSQKPAAASTNQVVDYAKPTGISAGNLIVGLLLALTVVGGGAFVFWNENRLKKLAAKVPAQYVTNETDQAQVVLADLKSELANQPIGEIKPELARLLPTLQQLDPRTLRALRIILSDRRRGEELLQSLSLINFSVLAEMKRLDKKDLSLLLALASES